jgi:hypothetical protein
MQGYSVRLSVLWPLLVVGTLILTLIIAGALRQAVGGGGAIIGGITLAVVGTLLHAAAGFALNSQHTVDGRRWHNKYYIGGLPVQFAGVPYLVIGWAVACYGVGAATSPWLGWPLLVLGPVAALVAYRALRRRPAAVA